MKDQVQLPLIPVCSADDRRENPLPQLLARDRLVDPCQP